MLLINSSVKGIDSQGINVLGDINIAKQQEIIFVCNKDAKDFPTIVYKFLRDVLRNGKRLFLVVIGNCQHKLFSNLMVSFGAYDIYQLGDEKQLNERFIRGMVGRKSGIDDVSQFVGCEAIAYGMLDSVLLSIAERADSLDISDEEADALIGGAEAVAYLKAVDADYNYKEKDSVIAKLKATEKTVTDAKVQVDSDLVVAKDTIANLNSRLEAARARVDELESAPVTQSVSTVRGAMTVQPVCNIDTLGTMIDNTKHILYFKELSYVPYVNTFVKYLADYLRTQKMAGKRIVCKMIVFDFNGTPKFYHPIPLLTGDEYMNRRVEMAGSRMELAVSTPQMAVLSDIVTGKFGGADTAPDVMIVYDRTRQQEDIVRGKIVTKFFVCHSKSSIERFVEDYRITDPTKIITRSDVFIDNGQLDIPRIKDYSSFESESRKKRAYLGLKTRYGQQPLIAAVLSAAKMPVT